MKSELIAEVLFLGGKDYIELVMKADNSSVPTPSKNPSKRPRVRCDKRSIAHKVCLLSFEFGSLTTRNHIRGFLNYF